MSGLGAFALGAAPLAGGLLVGGMAGGGGPSAPDLRASIKSEMDLLERIPEDQVTRRAVAVWCKRWPHIGHTFPLVAVSSCMPLSGVSAARQLFCALTSIAQDKMGLSQN